MNFGEPKREEESTLETERILGIKSTINGANSLRIIEDQLDKTALFGSSAEIEEYKKYISEIRDILSKIIDPNNKEDKKSLYNQRTELIKKLPRRFNFAMRVAEITNMSKELGVDEDIDKLRE